MHSFLKSGEQVETDTVQKRANTFQEQLEQYAVDEARQSALHQTLSFSFKKLHNGAFEGYTYTPGYIQKTLLIKLNKKSTHR